MSTKMGLSILLIYSWLQSLISSLPRQEVEMFTSSDVQQWLTDARQLEAENETLKKGITVLEHLLAEINLLSQPMEVSNRSSSERFLQGIRIMFGALRSVLMGANTR